LVASVSGHESCVRALEAQRAETGETWERGVKLYRYAERVTERAARLWGEKDWLVWRHDEDATELRACRGALKATRAELAMARGLLAWIAAYGVSNTFETIPEGVKQAVTDYLAGLEKRAEGG
jgi:hypothetical protein